MKGLASTILCGLAALAAGLWLGTGCASSTVTDFTGGNGGSSSTSGEGGTGGSEGGSGGEAGTGGTSPCPMDCSTINTDQCHEAVCDELQGVCAVVNADNGTPCDDDLFCTVNDSCQDGYCVGGGENDCSLTPPPCQEVTCNEGAQSCSTTLMPDGSVCIPSNLCIVNATCQGGSCQGNPKDCLFAPVPNECYTSECNLATGNCEPVPDNNGVTCQDENDPCLINGTCSNGSCLNTVPLDCTYLTVGCFNGQCNAAGQCEQVPVPAGGNCAAATDQCNQGICDTAGSCNPQPANQGLPCDTDGCFVGQTCSNGVCQGGAQITTCTNGDDCCPAACDLSNDDDCGCHWGLIAQETQFSTDAAITGLITAMGHTYALLENNGTTGVHSSNAATLALYETIIFHEHDRTISAVEQTNLTNFINNGGRLLVTGYDSLGSPTDAPLAAVVNCTGPADGPFSNALTVVNSTHPIMQGPFQAFGIGQTLTASTTDHDTCTPGPGAIQLLTVSTSSKLIITDNVGPGNGKVAYWNGNSSGSGPLTDWNGSGGTQPDLQNLLRNVLDHLCH